MWQDRSVLPEIVAVLAVTAVLAVVVVVLLRRIHPVPSGAVLYVTSVGGKARICTAPTFVPPGSSAELLDITTKTITIVRDAKRPLRCRDDIPARARLTFVVGTRDTPEDILRLRKRVSAAGLASTDYLHELLAPNFEQAIEAVVAQLDYEDLCRQRLDVQDEVLRTIGNDLDGLRLDSLAITDVHHLPLAELDPQDLHDACALRKLSEATSRAAIELAQIRRELEQQLAKQQLELDEVLLHLERMRKESVFRFEEQTKATVELDELRGQLDDRLREIVALVVEAERAVREP